MSSISTKARQTPHAIRAETDGSPGKTTMQDALTSAGTAAGAAAAAGEAWPPAVGASDASSVAAKQCTRLWRMTASQQIVSA